MPSQFPTDNENVFDESAVGKSDSETAEVDDATATLMTTMLIMAVVSVVCSIVSVAACACACYFRKAKQMDDAAKMMAMELQKTHEESGPSNRGGEAPKREAQKSATEIVLEAELAAIDEIEPQTSTAL